MKFRERVKDEVTKGMAQLGFDLEQTDVKKLIGNYVAMVDKAESHTSLVEKLNPSPDTVTTLYLIVMGLMTRDLMRRAMERFSKEKKKYKNAPLMAYAHLIVTEHDDLIEKGVIRPREVTPTNNGPAPSDQPGRTKSGLIVPPGTDIN